MTDFRAKGTIMGLAGLTAVFGMGTGVAPPVSSPEIGRGVVKPLRPAVVPGPLVTRNVRGRVEFHPKHAPVTDVRVVRSDGFRITGDSRRHG